MSRIEPYLGFARFLARRMGSHRVAQVSGSLTFTTLLALVPLFTIALTVISAFPVFSDLSTRFKIMLLSTLVPEFAGKVITVYMRQFADNAEKLTAAGIVMLGVTALMLMSTIDRTFNAIWGVRRGRPLLQQSMVYWTVLTLGPLVLGGSLLAWRSLFKVSKFDHALPVLANMVEAGGSILLTALVLSLLYRIVPNRFVPIKHASVGALLTAILLEATRALFGFYIGQVANYQLVYGAFASIPIFLLWVYCLWMVVLSGAVFTASLSYWEGDAWRRRFEPRRRFLDAVEVLLLLDEAQNRGELLSPVQLRSQVKVGYDELGWVLDMLSSRGFVQKSQRDGWVLGKKLSAICMVELFELFVYRSDNYRDDDVGAGVETLLGPMTAELQSVTLEDFARRVGRK
ncbi:MULTISPECIES: YihY family inner membrane protein [Chromobacterium]|nr:MULTISPECIES: YihY family inner membrane protein [Chromobacterium]AXT48287.1 YihY family inner membrane protein [Chromobacterium rhizoryzae]MDH0340377.1 YihY family inner membrane protein [Chromobacterium haemolyticum]QOD82255.1 YihY family inner membrane protein [Chromobacterium haemolyticum]QOZ82631.1 YihY family inner membrane protein [Chromobacterium sp. Rain0013]WON82688.1 YihY family inner membrane protein [Chromobacterium haemolyticum]